MDLGVDLGTTYSAVAAMEFTLRRERNLLVDLDSTILHIPMAEVARACKPLIDRTIETMEPLSSLLNGAKLARINICRIRLLDSSRTRR